MIYYYLNMTRLPINYLFMLIHPEFRVCGYTIGGQARKTYEIK